ncbi:MAG: hypothetical protein IKN65_00145 [Clostridia bacterium]|nr:hypothetical protein [Bacilli bacterium]MBR3672693.1 hypothetical protein [Clostridia bacterium]MBR4671567.1 hypothetical protein [Bacilli bacterium]
MASAKKEAQKSLGTVEDYINLSGLNKERELANDLYNTNYNQYTNTYNDLINRVNANRETARTDFGTGRATIAENSYLRNRSDLSDLASRGLSGGIAQLSKLGNRMETGRQYSNLANTYYNTMNDLDASQKGYENDYNYNLEMAKNSLNSALADVDAREAAGRNAYKASVAQLAEQIQARRDAASQAAAALKQAKKQYQDQLKAQTDAALISAMDNIVGNATKIDSTMYNKMISAYKNRVGGTDADAKNWLTSKNYIPTFFTGTSSNPKKF